MNIETLILDTNVLWNRDLCDRLTKRIKTGRLRVYIPTLVHAERIRQIANHYGEQFAIDIVRQFIRDARFILHPLSVEDAESVADVWLKLKSWGMNEDYWKQHRFDILLCAIACSTGYKLITAEEHGTHFEILTERMSVQELEIWLEEA